jgi:hypothetical protein
MAEAHEPATATEASRPPSLPPDPDAYDSPRAAQARARGLAAPYIAGGEDPDLAATRRRERRYLRLLIAMIVVVVLAGFVLGIVANLLGLAGLLGGVD